MPDERTASLMQSAEDGLPQKGFEEVPGAKLFKQAGGLTIEGHVKHITIYDPTASTNYYEESDQEVKKEVPQGYYVRVIGPASIRFTRM